MNTIEQIRQLNYKLKTILEKNSGVITLHFYDGRKITVNFISSNAEIVGGEESTITTFTNDIHKTTIHDWYQVREIS